MTNHVSFVIVAQFIHHKFLERIELDIDRTSGHVWSFKNTTLEENEYLIDWFLNFSCHPGKVSAADFEPRPARR